MTLTYNPPTGAYTQAIPPGTNALRREVARYYGITRTEVVRDQSRCAQTGSEHCECRAVDLFTTDLILGRRIFDWCVANAGPLGIQSVIFNRRVWGFGNWTERAYTGPSPHTDHVHVGLNKAASRSLTSAQVQQLLPGGNMALTDQDVQRIADAVFTRVSADMHGAVDGYVIPRLDAIKAKVESLGQGNVDVDAVAVAVASKVADVLAARLAQ